MASLARRISQKALLAIGARRPFDHAAMARRTELTVELSRLLGGKVASGPFAGMVLPEISSWGDGDRAPKLLGIYEENLIPYLAQATERRPNVV